MYETTLTVQKIGIFAILPAMSKKHQSKSKKTKDSGTIAVNRKARHDYFIEEHLEAGLVLMGWEVKSIRAGRAQMSEAHVIVRRGEAWLLNAHISPLDSASTHVNPEPTRTRKLLLHKKELNKLIGSIDRKGYTVVPLSMYWKTGKVKLEIGLAKGKKQYDKRADLKERDWQRQKQRLMKRG